MTLGHESPQDREDRITQRILAISCMALCALIVLILLLRDIPTKNEILLGTVVGFIFGNMVGPVFRKVFGGPDTGTRQAVAAQNDVLKSAVTAASSGAAGTPVVVEAPATVTVDPGQPVDPDLAIPEGPAK